MEEDSTPEINKEYLARLRALQDTEEDHLLLARLVRKFLVGTAAQFESMPRLLAAGDAETLAHEVHAVAGSSGMFGMARVRKLCLALENRVRGGSWEGADELLARAAREFERARPLLMAEFDLQD